MATLMKNANLQIPISQSKHIILLAHRDLMSLFVPVMSALFEHITQHAECMPREGEHGLTNTHSLSKFPKASKSPLM